jgi:ribosome-binding factor A
MQRELSHYLIKEVQNPHIGFVTIVSVRLNNDYTMADVNVSVMGDNSEQERSLKALQHSRGYLQHLLAKNIKIRNTPVLRFHLTDSLQKGDQVADFLDSLAEE